jgi:hypothetical protein
VFRNRLTLLTLVAVAAVGGCGPAETKPSYNVREKPGPGEYRPYNPGRGSFDRPPKDASQKSPGR